MWKKDEVTPPPNPTPRKEERPPRPEPPRPTTGTAERATIGRSITIRGEVSGEEDLLIQGRIEGSVDLQQQSVTVGREGRVKADITGRIVTVEGEVEGDLKAEEQVILRSSAQVQGDITAPRVVLEDGASFRGLVDMKDPMDSRKVGGEASAGGPKKAAGSDKSSPSSGKTTDDSGKKQEESDKAPDAQDKKSSDSKPSGASAESTKGSFGAGKNASGTKEATLL
jgi:cytoskeletal protein CcmA (bactofilin family)